MDYNVTVELEQRPDPDAVSDALADAGLDRDWSAVVHGAPDGRVAVTVSLRDVPDPGRAVDLAMTAMRHPWGVHAVGVLPTDEFDRRSGLLLAEGPQMLSVPEAAQRLGISDQRVRQLLTEGKLDGEKVGRDWLVNETSVTARIEGRDVTRA